MTRWLAVGPEADMVRACLMDGDILLEQSLFRDEEAALAAYPDHAEKAVRVGAGAPHATPTAILPNLVAQVPAVTQETPPDLLGGWARLRVAGVAASRPHWEGVVLDAGSESNHWVHVSADEIVSFQGAATPRLIAALDGAPVADDEAADSTLSRPERLSAHLHGALLAGDARAVTGHLLGAEIAAAKPYWLGQEVIVLSQTDTLAALLRGQGADAVTAAPDDMLARGLAARAAGG
ncbi:2-dehydro-3-deoxygalactonokinase [Roseovarius spongiae]|uniref:2-dehydro-3-deoxygalactonokinase n=1 Tax=Roseovarius spongiae TaxID=2320272 RepID=A0A3A8B2A8_9RHOB|nr:2-dehydro-3-deoxygalactonokinase [Roseovarius spongiae]RKF13453.1 2-dehydro-3-deoxygalactonokinase [Roseovarius spongiae]